MVSSAPKHVSLRLLMAYPTSFSSKMHEVEPSLESQKKDLPKENLLSRASNSAVSCLTLLCSSQDTGEKNKGWNLVKWFRRIDPSTIKPKIQNPKTLSWMNHDEDISRSPSDGHCDEDQLVLLPEFLLFAKGLLCKIHRGNQTVSTRFPSSPHHEDVCKSITRPKAHQCLNQSS